MIVRLLLHSCLLLGAFAVFLWPSVGCQRISAYDIFPEKMAEKKAAAQAAAEAPTPTPTPLPSFFPGRTTESP